jgi:hypothetical protein
VYETLNYSCMRCQGTSVCRSGLNLLVYDAPSKFCSSVAALVQLCCSSVSLSTNMYSHAGQILALECLFGGSETLRMHTRALSLFLPPAAPPSFSLCLSISLSFSLSLSLSFSLSVRLSVCLSLSRSVALAVSQHASHHIHLGNDVCCTQLSIHTSY